ncbi:MAG: PIG-L family deacetylase [SAR324 cluster bacterium]|nr:PIG-L family deacetylase [SAR324 cluster bacterium]
MRIVAIGAHLDDIELACGGTLALAIQRGHEVLMVIAAGGPDLGYDNAILRTSEQSALEAEAAAKVLGVEQLIRLDFPVKDVPYSSETVESFDKITKKFKPDLIFGHWPFDTHQDHQRTALASISASRYFNSILMFEPITPAGRSYIGFRPQMYVDITSTIDIKIKALKTHRSQYERYGERWLEAVRARANHRGFEMGVQYAEAYEIMRFEMKL